MVLSPFDLLGGYQLDNGGQNSFELEGKVIRAESTAVLMEKERGNEVDTSYSGLLSF